MDGGGKKGRKEHGHFFVDVGGVENCRKGGGGKKGKGRPIFFLHISLPGGKEGGGWGKFIISPFTPALKEGGTTEKGKEWSVGVIFLFITR